MPHSLRQTGLLDLIPRSCGRKRVVLGSVGVGGVGAGGDVSEGGNMWSGVGVRIPLRLTLTQADISCYRHLTLPTPHYSTPLSPSHDLHHTTPHPFPLMTHTTPLHAPLSVSCLTPLHTPSVSCLTPLHSPSVS
ncbi:hypothetical protein Pcinc_027178 [Petrolisthes cinctipes]|uniref:Uncharacterized protein n=1 Tax=Petrolisthes cinctipes TaxID=88211 RepID=A0AAE1F5A6_PETCI|nr:hypothetical protein Pcinc_027178 [Petrolisthes cinctipes]